MLKTLNSSIKLDFVDVESRQTDSDENNNPDDLEEEDIERPNSRAKMLSILQRVKSRTRDFSAASYDSTSPARTATERPKKRRKRDAQGHENNELSMQTKSLKVIIKRNDARLAKDSPLAKLNDHRDSRLYQERKRIPIPNIQEVDSDMGTDSNSRPEPAEKGITEIVKKDPGCESLLAPAFIQTGYDEINDVEILGSEVLGIRSNSSKANMSPSSNQGFQCSKCMRTIFGNKGSWIKHTVACNKIKKSIRSSSSPVTCMRCQVKFSSWKDLRRHQDESCKGSSVPPYTCFSCSKTFSKSKNLSDHLRRNCPSQKKIKTVRKTCGEKFSKKSKTGEYNDDDNEDFHEDEEQLVADQGDQRKTSVVECPSCKSTFVSIGNLTRHKKESCPGSKDRLRRHRRLSCKDSIDLKEKLRTQESQGEGEDLVAYHGNNEDNDAFEIDQDRNEEEEDHVEVNGDPDETQDDYVSCKCGDLFNQEDFARHQEQTGHTGERIKLPRTLRF